MNANERQLKPISLPDSRPPVLETVDKLESNAVTPAKAGVQRRMNVEKAGVPPLDPGFRRDDVRTETRSSRKSTVPLTREP